MNPESTREAIENSPALRLFVVAFRSLLAALAIVVLGGVLVVTHVGRGAGIAVVAVGMIGGFCAFLTFMGAAIALKKVVGSRPIDPFGNGAWLIRSMFRRQGH